MAIVLSSLVDYRRETAWARAMRARGVRVGFIGLAAQKLPQLFEADADFIVDGEPEAALHAARSRGETLQRRACRARRSTISTALPFPVVGAARRRAAARARAVRGPAVRRVAAGAGVAQLPGVLHLLPAPDPGDLSRRARWRTSSTSCQYLQDTRGPLHIVFRDPLFSQERDRVLELCDGIRAARLAHTFECETRLDRLDGELLDDDAPRRACAR